MKTTKRITALVLALVMLFTLAAPGAWTVHVHATEIDLEDLHIVQINPLYADVITEDDLVKHENTKLYADNRDGEYYYSFTGAGDLIRDDLVARDQTIIVDVYGPHYGTSEDALNETATDLVYNTLGYAMVHTGVPTEGDYLQWQWAGWEAEISDASYNDTNLFMTVTYTMTYYTTAAQEAEMNTAVANLLEELNVYDGDNYTKLKAIYDYICANVEYDHEHVNDESYKMQYTAYAALMDGVAVCQGYALLLYRLALELGVDARLIAGDGGGPHGWNIAEIDGLYYNLDSTWDAGYSSYKYFLVCPDNFTDHVRYEDYDTDEFHEHYPMADEDYVVCDHVYEGTVTTEASCEEDGVMTYTCTGCGDSYTEAIPATGHTWDEGAVTAPTCTEQGYTTYTCTACGATNVTDYTEIVEHTYDDGVVTTEPTCTENGVMTYTCTVCGDSYTEAIPATDHTLDAGTVTKEPTCTEEGESAHPCTVCGEIITDVLPALGHSWDEGSITTPTCTEEGYTTYTCSVCFESEVRDQVPALGHSWDEGTVTKEPDCIYDGEMTYTCTTCGESTIEAIPTPGHSWDEGVVTTEPTCTTMGKITYTCTDCNSVKYEDILYTPHEFLDGACIHCGGEFHTPEIYSCYSKAQTSVKVSWFSVESAEGYELYRTTTPDDESSWAKVKTINDGSTDRYTNQGLEIGTTYYYKVRAFVTDVNGERMYSEFSNVDYMPAAVVFDGPYSNATFRIRLRWNEIDGAHGYQIWRQNADGSWNIVKTLGDKGNELTNNQGATTAYSNTGLTAGENYTYKMRAFMITEDGRKVFGAYSDEYTVAAMPDAPVVTGTSPKATRAQLTWDALNGAAGYQIWMAEAEDGEYKIVKSVTDGSTTYTKYDLTSGKTYYFKVRAYTEVEGKKTFGAYSEIVSVDVQ